MIPVQREVSRNKVVSFLYELMRDHVPTGVAEHVVKNSENDEPTTFSNGYLARYAKDLARRLGQTLECDQEGSLYYSDFKAINEDIDEEVDRARQALKSLDSKSCRLTAFDALIRAHNIQEFIES